MCISVCMHVSVCTMCVLGAPCGAQDMKSLGAGDACACVLFCGCWEPNLCFL